MKARKPKEFYKKGFKVSVGEYENKPTLEIRNYEETTCIFVKSKSARQIAAKINEIADWMEAQK